MLSARLWLVSNGSFCLVNYDGVVSIINGLKVSSFCGIDNNNSTLLRGNNHMSSLFLTIIFQQPLETRQLPEYWKFDKVVLVQKSGSRPSPTSFRPFLLLPFHPKYWNISFSSIWVHFYNPTPFSLSLTMASVITYPKLNSYSFLMSLYWTSAPQTLRSLFVWTSLKTLTRYLTTYYFWNLRR